MVTGAIMRHTFFQLVYVAKEYFRKLPWSDSSGTSALLCTEFKKGITQHAPHNVSSVNYKPLLLAILIYTIPTRIHLVGLIYMKIYHS